MKKLLIILIVLCFVVSCSSSKEQGQVVLKIGHNAAAEDLRTATAEKFVEKLEELTGGSYTAEIYPASQLGDTREMLEGLDIGSVDIVLDGLDVLEIYGRIPSIAGIFFLYRDNDHFVDVWTSEISDKIRKDIEEETGMYPAGFMNRGPRNITSIKPVEKMEDFNGLKIRVPNSPAMIAGFKAIGASPIPMGFSEVFNALERKVIDAQENPYNTSYVGSMHQVAPYIIETAHIYTPANFIMSSRVFRSYPEDIQNAIEEAIQYACDYFNEQTLKVNQDSLDAMKEESDVKYIVLSDEEKQKIVEKARSTYKNFPHLSEYINSITNM